MADHDHILRGDVVGCPACDLREGRTNTLTEPPASENPETPDHVRALLTCTHRISDGRAVCDGDRTSRCHWYPDDCGCEYWPCGHEYVAHDRCWILDWLNAGELYDVDIDEGEHRDPETLEYPDGLIEWEWGGEGVLWRYEPIEEPAR